MLDQGKPLLETSKERLIADRKELTDDVETQINLLLEDCQQIGNSFTNDYLSADEKYHFVNIQKKYGMTDDIINKIGPDDIERKRKYILLQFYKSFDKLRDLSINNPEEYTKMMVSVLDEVIKEHKDDDID